MDYPAVISTCAQNVAPGLKSTETDVSKTKEALKAVQYITLCVPAPGSPDHKPDDPEYKALRDQASSTLEAFSQFLPKSTPIELVSEVDNVFYVLRKHGEKAGLLSPPLIRAMSRYLDAYKKEQGELPYYMEDKEEWISTLYRNLKPDDSRQVRLLPFFSYESVLTSNFTAIQNHNASVVASASADAADSDKPPVNLASATADTTTNCASHPILSLQGASSARPEGSCPEASPLAFFPAPSTAQIQETASVERTQGVPRAENTPAPQKDSGYARADPDEVSATPAPVGFSGASDANPQETESPSGSFPDAPRLTSLPAPSTARAQESASVERTQGVPRAEDTPALQEDPGPACADLDEVSETPASVGSGGTSKTNPQETESPSTEVSPILPSAVAPSSSSLADTSEKK